jgi:hypothetical protein
MNNADDHNNAEPPSKMKMLHQYRMSNTIFKQLSEIKAYPMFIYNWFLNASESERALGGSYGLHLLVTANRFDLMGQAIEILGVKPDNVTNPEIGILLVQYLTQVGHMEPIGSMIDRLISSGSGVRKRIVDLFLQGAYKLQAWETAKHIIYRYLRGVPFLAEASDLVPLIKYDKEYLTWFHGKEIYFPSVGFGVEGAPDASLQKLPLDLEEVKSAICRKLPLKDGSPIPVHTVLALDDIEYIIDGANVLFTHDGQTLTNIINSLPRGRVALVMHCRHFDKPVTRYLRNLPAVIVATPYGVDDDYYALLLAMKCNAFLITNDMFRDHVHHISPLIKTWYKQFVIGFNGSRLIYPPTFSHCIQCLNNDVWLPTADVNKWIKI